MANLQQAEEIEALNSIYGAEWAVESETDRCFSIQVSSAVKLFLTLNSEYPSKSPPTYQLLAPYLSRSIKEKIANLFDDIYLQNIGGPILFQWIECLRDILNEVTDGQDDIRNSSIENNHLNTCNSSEVDQINLNVIHGTTISDRKSTFQGHVCAITTQEEVELVMRYLLQNKKIAQATHNIFAYRIKSGNGSIIQDCEDDGENQAGSRLLHMLQIIDVSNVVVVVSRWYGGIHLGPNRFRHINNAARQVLEQGGYIKRDKN